MQKNAAFEKHCILNIIYKPKMPKEKINGKTQGLVKVCGQWWALLKLILKQTLLINYNT